LDCRAKELRKGTPMQRYIGLDVHAASTTFAVVGESGKRLESHLVETNGHALVEQLKAIAGKRHVPRRTCRLGADASVEGDGWRSEAICLDTTFHRSPRKAIPTYQEFPADDRQLT
jgi:hypothetical protein